MAQGIVKKATTCHINPIFLYLTNTANPCAKITTQQFKRAINRNPAWSAKLTEPVEITDYCKMTGSRITHLSPLLHFVGRDEFDEAACFNCCNHLKVAEGHFAGFVVFTESGVEKIGDLHITGSDTVGQAAYFDSCKSLKVAEGTFPGSVNFSNSGIERIGELKITATDDDGAAAHFNLCKNLKVARGNFPGYVAFSGSGVEKIEDLDINKPNMLGMAAALDGCEHLKVAEGIFPGFVDFEDSGVETVGKLIITKANTSGHKANFRGCAVRLSKIFLGPEYQMDDELRQKNLQRVAVSNALNAAPDIEF